MSFFSRKPKITKAAVDDVLQLSTEKNLEHHAEVAAEKVDGLLSVAIASEDERAEELEKASERFQLAQAIRENKEKLAKSVTSLLNGLRK